MIDVETPHDFTSHSLISVEMLCDKNIEEKLILNYRSEYTDFLEESIT